MRNLTFALKLLLFSLAGIVLHVGFIRFLGAPFALFLVVSNLIAWNSRQAGLWLVGLSFIGELFSALPPGILLLVCLLALAGARLRGRIEIDISVTFFAWLAVIVAVQQTIILTAAIGLTSLEWSHVWPLTLRVLSPLSIVVWLLTSSLTTVASLVWQLYRRSSGEALTLVSRRLTYFS